MMATKTKNASGASGTKDTAPSGPLKRLFKAEDLLPRTGLPEAQSSGAVFAALGAKIAAFDGIYVSNPAHNRAHAGYEELRQLGRAGSGRKWAIRNLAMSGSGKTTSFLEYQRWVEEREGSEDGIDRVVHIPLDRACTTRRLWSSVLDHYGDRFYGTRDTEETLRKRAYGCFEKFGTELLGLDEVQHLAFRSTDRNDVTDAIKRTLDDGVVTIALLGTEKAETMLNSNAQLANRLLPPVDIRALDPRDGRDRADYAGFLKRLDRAMVDAGLIAEPSGLDRPAVVACMFQITAGVIGRAVNLVRHAYSLAHRRDAATVEVCDLSNATTAWAIAQGLTTYNPFVLGAPDHRS